jgi:hypothetical protein
MTEKLPWRMPTVEQAYDAFSERQDWERFWIEQDLLGKYVHGVSSDDLEEAAHHWIVDLLKMGHYPSRQMLGNICSELQRLYWPDQHRKQRQRIREQALLWHDHDLKAHLARTKYGNVHGAQTKAEQDVAERHGLTVFGLRKSRPL